MNTKIFALIKQNLDHAFALPKYESIRDRIGLDTVVEDLPWTPARYRKFREAVEGQLDLASDWTGSLAEIVADLDRRYLRRFFGEIWKPRTDDYNYTGWPLVEEINRADPQNVLDVGCGYNQFRGRIPNLIGIDPYNDCADYMVDILDYRVRPGTHDHIICLGSINFNSREDIEARFAHCVDLLAPGGHMYFRANPGIQWKNGPWVEIFAWSFQVVKELEETYQLRLLTFKQDNDRLYFVYQKPGA
jgi:SAM-dependent methyltransferase